MKVTVDTRHDSLEEALATVRAAFGSNGTSADDVGPRVTSPKAATSSAPTPKRARSADRTTARPTNKRPPAKKTTAPTSSGRNRTKAAKSMSPTSNIAPPGQADAIRAWAKGQGMQVKQAGRLPSAVIRAYQESSNN